MSIHLNAAMDAGINPSHGMSVDTLVTANATTDLGEFLLYKDQRTNLSTDGVRKLVKLSFTPQPGSSSVTGHASNIWTLKVKKYAKDGTGGGTVAVATTAVASPGSNGLAALVEVSSAFTLYGSGSSKTTGSNAASQAVVNATAVSTSFPGGLFAGDKLVLSGGGKSEILYVSSVSTNAVTMTTNLLNTYAAGAILSRAGNVVLEVGDSLTVSAVHGGTPDAAFPAGRWVCDVDVPVL